MVEFSHEYFEDEVRDGFYVNGLMKKCWAAQIEVLSDIASVCAKYNIRWFADCGTLLGAVRHGGFIPWDDDLDICMFREDYVRFLSVAEKELKSIYGNYRVHNFHNEDFWEMISRVDNATTIEYSEEHLAKFHGYPFRAGVDIFPLDYMCENRAEEEERMFAAQMVFTLASREDLEELNDDVLSYLDDIEFSLGAHFDRNNQLRRQLFAMGEALFSMYKREESNHALLMPFWLKDESHVYPLELYENTVMIPFENVWIPAPAMYNEVLKIEYGDYMKIVRSGSAHEYPYHDEYIKMLNDNMGERSPFWKKVSKEEVVENISAAGFDNVSFGEQEPTDEDGESNQTPNNSSEKEECKKKKMVFFPYKSSKWKYMEYEWKKACKDPNAEVSVVPIPYYEKGALGSLGREHYDIDSYPDYVQVRDYLSYDLQVEKPDVAYIQNPYDDDNYTCSVNPYFYAKNLKKYVKELVYIPCFYEDEISQRDERAFKSMTQYVISPGVVYADQIILQSEQMKEAYVKKLVDYFGEDTRTLWENKIDGNGIEIYESALGISEKNYDVIPDDWKKIILKEDGSAKKVIIYHVSISSMLENKDKIIEKVRSALETFKNNNDEITVVWHSDPLIVDTLPVIDAGLYEKYMAVVEGFNAENWGIHYDGSDIELMLPLVDAYYGDTDRVIQQCRMRKIPVMIQNVDV